MRETSVDPVPRTGTRSGWWTASVRPAGWWFDGLLLAGLVGLTLALAQGHLLGLDLAVRDWVDGHRPEPAYSAARVVNFLGQGGWVLMPVTGVLAGVVTLRTRSVRPVLLGAATFVLTSFTIGPLKLLLHRGYPHNWALAHPEKLFSDPGGGMAYPSGHVANAIVWYAVIAVLLGAALRAYRGRPGLPHAARLAIRVLPAALVFGTTTYLGFHWLTDSVAGLLLGLLLYRLLARVRWDELPLPALLRGLDGPAGLDGRAGLGGRAGLNSRLD